MFMLYIYICFALNMFTLPILKFTFYTVMFYEVSQICKCEIILKENCSHCFIEWSLADKLGALVTWETS